jgi:hypothetical protein
MKDKKKLNKAKINGVFGQRRMMKEGSTWNRKLDTKQTRTSECATIPMEY